MEEVDQSNNPRARWKLIWKCVLIGLAGGLMVSLYRIGIVSGTDFAISTYSFMEHNPIYIPIWVVFSFVVGYVIYRIIKWEPSASGSGVPQVKGNVMLGLKMNGFKVLLARFSGGLLGGLFGLSVGREGPSIHISAATAKPISDKIGKDEFEKRLLITSGAAAGLSAAFNAPISGMVFALEEIHHSFSEYVLLAGIAASLSADLVASYIFGMTPVLDFMDVPEVALDVYWWFIPISIAAGILGWLMNFSFIKMQNFYRKFPPWLAPGIALLIALPIGMYLPDALGSGEGLVGIAEKAEIGIGMIFILLVTKILFSSSSFGCGVPGGIFMPILAVGALGGSLIGLVMVYFGMPSLYVCNCAVYCMAGTLASSLRAPMTAIMLVTEMTAMLIHLLPVAVCVLIAYVVSGLMGSKPIYDVLLGDYLNRNPDALKDADEPLSKLGCEN
ncbi:MAG: ClC family H(+)/Cl(-) exchange transporter [Candidatus Methanomethylophilaceae archaeon]|nr:ClC family H(+)/Cl(-) exchange transporter [Candidatus Methanomethylophilaceae archaeon]